MKKRVLIALVVMLALATTASVAWAHPAIRYVAPGGTDAGDCTTSPCATIGYAISKASDGDTIEVAAGTYNEVLTINTASLTIQSTAGAKTTIIDAGAGANDVVSITADGVTFSGFTLQNANGTYVTGLYMDGVDGCTVSNLVIKDITGTERAQGIRADTVDTSSFSNIQISDLTETQGGTFTGQAAFGVILAYGSHDNTFTDITISNLNADNDAQGVFLYSNCNENSFINTDISNLTATNYYACGINIWGRDPNPASSYNTFAATTISNLSGRSSVYGIQNRGAAGDEHMGNEFRDTHISDLTSTHDVVLVIYNEGAKNSKFTDTYISDITASRVAIGINNAFAFDDVVISGGEIKGLSAHDWSAGVNFVASTSKASVERMAISGTARGIRISSSADASQVSIHDNNIAGNTEYGVLNEDNQHTLDATYNWWGNPNGPSWVNPAGKVVGQGDAVSADVDYSPWLRKPAPIGPGQGPQ